jgi:hypothetical protein
MVFKETGCDGIDRFIWLRTGSSGDVLKGIYWLTVDPAPRRFRIKGKWW